MSRGFNADARAKEREEGPVVIGGRTYHATRLTNKRLRDIRRISRKSQKDAREAAIETEEYREEFADAKREGLDDEKARERALDAGMSSEAVDEINRRSLAEQLPLLLVDDSMQPITEEQVIQHLDDDLDTRDVGDLMSYLLGPSTDESDPQTGS